MNTFLDELKRRRVVRTALVYMGVAFVLLQAVDIFVEAFQLPQIVYTTLGLAAILGLPVTLIVAWAFDVERTDESAATEDDSRPGPAASWMTLRSIIAIVSLVSLGLLLGILPRYFVEDEPVIEVSDKAEAGSVRRYGILLPEDAPVDFVGSSALRAPIRALAITPDGNRLVYAGPAQSSPSQLYIRDLSEFEVQAIPGTLGAYRPFISPDGSMVAFFAFDELRVVSLDGGTVRTIIATPNPRGGVWWGNDRIIYSDREGNETWWIAVAGGEPVRLPDLPPTGDGTRRAININFSPLAGGMRLMTSIFPGPNGELPGALAAFDPATYAMKTLIPMPVSGKVATDQLVYLIGNDLLAVDFDRATTTVSGEPRRVGSDLRRDGPVGQFVLSDHTLIYATGVPYRQKGMSRIGPDGKLFETVIPPGPHESLAISPDGSQVAITQLGNNLDIHVFDLETGRSRRITRGGDNQRPAWSEDGQTLYFTHLDSDQPPGIYRIDAQSPAAEKSFVAAPAGRSSRIEQIHAGDIATVPTAGGGSSVDYLALNLRTGEVTPIATRENVHESLGHISPDGKWLALTVDASGRYEIIVQPLGGDGPAVQVSYEGGEEPLWAPDMKTLFYRYGTQLFKVSVSRSDAGLVFGDPVIFFDNPQWTNVGGYSYWRMPTDGSFLIRVDKQPTTTRELRVVEGWKNIR